VTPLETGILSVVGVAVLAFIMKAVTGEPKSEDGQKGPDVSDQDIDELLEEVSGSASDVVAITSDGWGFVPKGEDVLLFPPRDGEDVEALRSSQQDSRGNVLEGDSSLMRNLLSSKPEFTIEPGDMIAARVVRGAPGHDPWRLEALGRDREYRAWFFETPVAANAALDILRQHTVRPPLDADGEPETIPDSEFDAARERDEETERALDDPDE